MTHLEQILSELKSGETVLYLGMGIFKGCLTVGGESMPFDSDSMILALNDNRPMSHKLSYEYTRAAMSIEQSHGRKVLEQKTKDIYQKSFARPSVFELIKKLMPNYVIDTNYDDSLQKLYADRAHFVIYGRSRLGAEHDRFEIFEWDMASGSYEKKSKEQLHTDIPIIFKPMGSIAPQASLIISDADFVDWLTEAMGGFAVPAMLKEFRVGKKYLLMGLSFAKDTERMVANELTSGLAGGYFVSDTEPVKNCLKFLEAHKMEFIGENANSFAAKLLEL